MKDKISEKVLEKYFEWLAERPEKEHVTISDRYEHLIYLTIQETRKEFLKMLEDFRINFEELPTYSFQKKWFVKNSYKHGIGEEDCFVLGWYKDVGDVRKLIKSLKKKMKRGENYQGCYDD